MVQNYSYEYEMKCMFINDVVAKFGSDTIRDQYSTNNKGTIIQGILFVLIYSLFETLIKSKVL